MKASVVAAALLLSVGQALAQCPAEPGFWPADFLAGSRAAESFCGADGEPPTRGAAGNIVEIQSWDDIALGAHWRFWDLEIGADGAVVVDNVDGDGNGWKLYRSDFLGGRYQLCACAPWSDDPDDMTGQLIEAEAFTSVTFLDGEMFDAVSNYRFLGTIENCVESEYCQVEFEIHEAIRTWTTSSGDPAPGDYPPFPCADAEGELLESRGMTIQVVCPLVGVEEESWGAVKARYR